MCVIVHEGDVTHVEVKAFDTRGDEDAVDRYRYRYVTGAAGPPLVGYGTSSCVDGLCVACTLRWRYTTGAGVDISDVEALPEVRGKGKDILAGADYFADVLQPERKERAARQRAVARKKR